MTERSFDWRSLASRGGGTGGNGNTGGSAPSGGLADRIGTAWYGENREVGQTRARMRGYLSNLRESAQQNYTEFSNNFRGVEDFDEVGSQLGNARIDDANVTKSSDGDEMILFPSYSRRHRPKKTSSDNSSDPNDTEKSGSDSSNGQTIQQHWDHLEDRNAIVDVDVRGWIYTPHRGAMTRKQRLMLGIARKIAGIPTVLPGTGSSESGGYEDGRSESPHPIRHKIEEHNARKEDRIAEEEADYILRKRKDQTDTADRGEYSEPPGEGDRIKNKLLDQLKRTDSQSSVDSATTKAQVRAAWSKPADMSQEEAALANTNLMSRLRPFYTIPKIEYPINVFFYNKDDFRKHITKTNAYGQFALRAALDFVPTHVRIILAEGFAAGMPVKVSESAGISVISDIDDTIKHTGMLISTREAFRNAFMRNLDDLVVDGVEDWYQKLASMGVEFHYVSNSPWQLFPAISMFFNTVGLPQGSFHLKQYNGMQGLFEPVAERKKSTLDRIARDFPERYFILVGDSGEADLEVYQDFVRDNPGRVLGVFIRDVTTPSGNHTDFFDSNLGRDQSPRRPSAFNDEKDPELRAAIEASVRQFEEEDAKRRGSAPQQAPARADDLMSFSDTEADDPVPSLSRRPTNSFGKAVPPPPRKPGALKGSSLGQGNSDAPPPRPPRPSASRTASAASAPPTTFESASSSGPLPPALPPRRAITVNPTEPESDAKPSSTMETLASYPVSAASTAARAISSVYPGGASSQNASSSTLNLNHASTTQLTKSQANRVELWKRRWKTAEDFLGREGVVLRSWKVGTDAEEDSVNLVHKGETLVRKLREGRETLIEI